MNKMNKEKNIAWRLTFFSIREIVNIYLGLKALIALLPAYNGHTHAHVIFKQIDHPYTLFFRNKHET